MCHTLDRSLDPLTLPGALVPGLRSQFGGVVAEPVPEPLAAQMRRLRELQHNEGQNDPRTLEQEHGPEDHGPKDDGPSIAKAAHRLDRRGRR
jgi:hypothetical protein